MGRNHRLQALKSAISRLLVTVGSRVPGDISFDSYSNEDVAKQYSMESLRDRDVRSSLELSDSGLLSRMRSVCNRYENVVRVLIDLISLYIEGINSGASRSRFVDLLTPIKHYDPTLFDLVKTLDFECTQAVGESVSPQKRLPVPTSLSAERVTHTEVVPPSISPDMGSLNAVIQSISKQNQALIDKWNLFSNAKFDYVCIRLYKLKGTKTLGTRDKIPSPGVFITVNSVANSTLAFDGDWCGETMTVPVSDSKGVQIDLRLENGTVLAQSLIMNSEDFYVDTKEVPLGDSWSLSIGIVLGISPSSVFSNFDNHS